MKPTHPFDHVRVLHDLALGELARAYTGPNVAHVQLAERLLFDVPPEDTADVTSFERAVHRCADAIKKWNLLLGDAMLENTAAALTAFVAECTSPFYRAIAQTQSLRRL